MMKLSNPEIPPSVVIIIFLVGIPLVFFVCYKYRIAPVGIIEVIIIIAIIIIVRTNYDSFEAKELGETVYRQERQSKLLISMIVLGFWGVMFYLIPNFARIKHILLADLAVLFFAVEWLWRRLYQQGATLLNTGYSSSSQYYLFRFAIFGFVASIVLLLLDFPKSFQEFHEKRMIHFCCLFILFYYSTRNLTFNAGGIDSHKGFFRWQRIRHWKWSGPEDLTLSIRYQPRLLPIATINFRISAEYKDELDRIMNNYMGKTQP